MLEVTVWLKNETSIGPVGDMIGSLNIGGVGEDERLTLHSILAKDQISIWTRLRDACEEQIKRLTESASKAEAEKAAGVQNQDAGNFEALPDGGYLSPGPAIEPMPESHKSAAAVIEEDIPAPQRIEQTVRIPSMEIDDSTPF